MEVLHELLIYSLAWQINSYGDIPVQEDGDAVPLDQLRPGVLRQQRGLVVEAPGLVTSAVVMRRAASRSRDAQLRALRKGGSWAQAASAGTGTDP